ncbi:MAG: SH3 domain-containing protein [Chloroflexota bacterium]
MRLHIKRFYQSTVLAIVILSVACGPQSSPQNTEPTATELQFVATPVPTLAMRPIDTPTVIAMAQATLAPTATIDPNEQDVDVYPAPDGTSAIIRKVNAIAPFKIIGRTADNTWIQVSYDDGLEGWVIVTAYKPEGIDSSILDAAPVIDPAQLTPTAEPPGLPARVSTKAGGLRLRRLPDTTSTVLFNLPAGSELHVTGHTTDNAWALVKMSEGYVGWVSTSYLEIAGDWSTVPSIENPEPAPYVNIPPPPGAPQVSSGVTGGARQIFLKGQALGNRANVFTKVGDSLTDTPYFLRYFVTGYNLRDYGYLLPVLQYFSAATALDSISFGSTSRAAHASWSTFSVLDAANSDPSACQAGELPIACEYRTVKPAVALVMIGTNDAPAFPPSTYEANMRRIIEISIEMGVVPVLSTLPPRADFNDNIIAYNQVITNLSSSYGVPLWDLYTAVVNLPNRGYGPDGIHLSTPPNAPASTTDFTGDNLKYGTTMRNLTALQILDTVWKQVLY